MDAIDANYPQFIKLDKETKTKYLEPLINTPSSQFYNREQGEIYFIAAALGFRNNKKQKSEKSTDIRTYVGAKDNYKLLIRLVSLSEANFEFDILKDGSKVLKTIEEYANGGMALLYDKIFNNGKFSIEDELWEEIVKAKVLKE